MKLTDARKMAVALMREHGMFEQGWGFRWDRAKRRHGMVSFGSKSLSLSAPLTAINDESTVRNTVLHEIAHFKAGPNHGHDRLWKSMAIQVGAKPERCCSEGEQMQGRIIGTCSQGHESTRFRRPKAGSRYLCCAEGCKYRSKDDRVVTWRAR